MKALLQRVSQAHVSVDNQIIASIEKGLLVFVAVEKGDQPTNAEKLLQKILHYRLFSDAQDKMNLNLQQIAGDLLIVSQFTLAANTDKGLRPSFSVAAPPSHGKSLYDYFVQSAEQLNGCYGKLATGQFGADMQVALVNDGPVTFLLTTR